MTPQEDFILGEFYTLTDEDNASIKKASSDPLKKEDWEDSCLDSFKARVRNFLVLRQQSLCAYCRLSISDATFYNSIEHIAPKDTYPKWIFKPQNYCIVCMRCNSHKRAKETLSNPHCQAYPTDSNGFLIINPYYDKYSDHIEIVEDIFYSGKTQKGINTIEKCGLSRYQLALERLRERFRHQPQKSFSQALTILPMNNGLVNDSDELLKQVNELIAHAIPNIH